jgi:hypothetical protein
MANAKWVLFAPTLEGKLRCPDVMTDSGSEFPVSDYRSRNWICMGKVIYQRSTDLRNHFLVAIRTDDWCVYF